MANKQEEQNALIVVAREKFELACKDAQQLQIVNNFGAAFVAVGVVSKLREALTDEVMKQVFMPLMNTTIGFRTDRDPKRVDRNGKSPIPYDIPVVRDAIIDAVAFGLLPTGNQMNIIAERMYPTKEGYTALLRKIGCKYFISYGAPRLGENTADVDCKISYEYGNEKKSFGYVANVKKDGYSSIDQIKGKAERKAKKVLYEFITGVDLGDADEASGDPVDEQQQPAEVVNIPEAPGAVKEAPEKPVVVSESPKPTPDSPQKPVGKSPTPAIFND